MEPDYHYQWPLSLGLSPILGDRWLRQIYVDESGTSRKEPVVVCAGAIVDPDRQYRDVAREISELKLNELGPEFSKFPFHASALFKCRDYYRNIPLDEARRLEVILKMAKIADRHDIPVAFSWIRKEGMLSQLGKDRNNALHTMAFCALFSIADKFIAKWEPEHVASVIAERVDHMKHLEDVPSWFNEHDPDPESWIFGRSITNIVNDIQWARKGGSPILELADALAWSFRAFLSGHYYKDEIAKVLFNRKAPWDTRDIQSESIGATIWGSYAAPSQYPSST